MDISDLEVYKFDGLKVRLGSQNDGGYVICDIQKGSTHGRYEEPYDLFLSCGVGTNITFEEAFLKRYPDVKCIAFDGTLSDDSEILKKKIHNLEIVRKNIHAQSSPGTTNLHEYLDKYQNIFVKMDIEGAEFPWINSLSRKQLKSISQLVIEFHYPFNDINWLMISKLNKTHWLMHLHPNNSCEVVTVVDAAGHQYLVPSVFECTFVRKEHPKLNDEPIPSKIDSENDGSKPPVILFDYPYCTM
jgi:hypothetical protein